MKSPNLLFVVGMQKSGTSLMNRMLMRQPFIENPFLPEGARFWGDIPPFSPNEKPAGQLFQQHKGANGHFLNKDDYHPEDNSLLIKRINDADISADLLMNKNPYNSVRVEWVKSHFPNSKIIAIFRKPVPNIFSLLKKYVIHEDQEVRPENGWWGIKPKFWKNMLNDNKLLQCSDQWTAVNNCMIENSKHIDYFFDYEDICDFPNKIIDLIMNQFQIKSESKSLPQCKNFNEEYLLGSRLKSKNIEMRKHHAMDLSELSETIQFPAFSDNQIMEVQKRCHQTWKKLSALKHQHI